MDEQFLRHAELHLRLQLHSLVPLHECVVEAMCKSSMPPLELATTLEDIGQRYIKMAETLNGEIIRLGRLDDEPEEYEDFAESRIERFSEQVLSSADSIVFADGTQLDAGAALRMSPFVANAIRAAILIAYSRRLPNRRVTIPRPVLGNPPV